MDAPGEQRPFDDVLREPKLPIHPGFKRSATEA